LISNLKKEDILYWKMKIVKYCCGFFILGAIMTDVSWAYGDEDWMYGPVFFAIGVWIWAIIKGRNKSKNKS